VAKNKIKKYQDRGIQKWAAFNSVTDNEELMEDVDSQRLELKKAMSKAEFFDDI